MPSESRQAGEASPEKIIPKSLVFQYCKCYWHWRGEPGECKQKKSKFGMKTTTKTPDFQNEFPPACCSTECCHKAIKNSIMGKANAQVKEVDQQVEETKGIDIADLTERTENDQQTLVKELARHSTCDTVAAEYFKMLGTNANEFAENKTKAEFKQPEKKAGRSKKAARDRQQVRAYSRQADVHCQQADPCFFSDHCKVQIQ